MKDSWKIWIVNHYLDRYGFTATLHNLVIMSTRDPEAEDLLPVLPIITVEREFLDRIQHVMPGSVLSEICYKACDNYLR